MTVWTVGSYYAPMYWGFVLATSLLGTTFVQAFIYFDRNTDAMIIQVLVTIVVILDTADTLTMAMTIYHYFVNNFGNYWTFAIIVPPWFLETGLTSLITAIVQVFFATRIYLVMRQYPILPQCDRLLPFLVFATAIVGLGAGLAKMVLTHILSVWSMGDIQMLIVTCLEEGFSAISDTITTSTLCYILASTPGGVKKTKFRIRKLFFFVLTRGILVTIIQIGLLAAYASATFELYWMPFHLCKSKLYTNTLLAMLNSRERDEGWPKSQTREMSRAWPSTENGPPMAEQTSGVARERVPP